MALLPIVCETPTCTNSGLTINTIDIEDVAIARFAQTYGAGTETLDDECGGCGVLGALYLSRTPIEPDCATVITSP